MSALASGELGEARKSATAVAAAAISAALGDVAPNAVFLCGEQEGELLVAGVCSTPQHELDVCHSRAQMLARSLEFGPDHLVWCTLDAAAEGIGTAASVCENKAREATYKAAASALARTISHSSPSQEVSGERGASSLYPDLAIGGDVGGAVSRSAAVAAPTLRHP